MSRDITLTLTEADINLLGFALGKLSIEQGEAFVNKIRNQVAAQLTEVPELKVEPAIPAAE